MAAQYPFFNRKRELEELNNGFRKHVIRGVGGRFPGYIIKGRKGIGKSRLIHEFIDGLQDVEILSDIPNFDPKKHVIEHACHIDENDPYFPFVKITEHIYQEQRWRTIGIRFLQLGLAIFGVNDAMNALNDLVGAVKKGKSDSVLSKKEAKTFNTYRKFIKRLCKRTPIIIYIRNAQWIDVYSLKLINKLMEEKETLWGMIILEKDEADIEEGIQSRLNQFILEGKFSRLELGALKKSFPGQILNQRFGSNFFTGEENDILYTISEGSPGILISFIEDQCMKNRWIYKEGNSWHKAEGFREKIKPPSQKLIELVISLYEDKELSESEFILIKKMAVMWGISNEVVTGTISMVKDIMNIGFKILSNLGPGIVSKNCFLVSDDHGERFIIEYLKRDQSRSIDDIKPRDIEHQHLLEAGLIRMCEDGILIGWNYFEGKRSRQVIMEALNDQVSKNIDKFLKISEGLAELHRNEIVHGFIKPESIIETKEGNFQLATFNINVIRFLEESTKNGQNDLHYSAPEQLENKELGYESDIYSLGVMFFRSLTDQFPFTGNNKEDLLRSIKEETVQFGGYWLSQIDEPIKHIITKCLSYEASHRYRNAVEFHNELLSVSKAPVLIPQPELIETNKKQSFSYKKLMIPSLIVFMAIIGYYFLNNPFGNGKNKITKDVITLSISSESKTQNKNRHISAESIHYLIQSDIMHRTNEIVMSTDDFNKIYKDTDDEDFIPQKQVKAHLIFRDFDYELILDIVDADGKQNKLDYDFEDPSELLQNQISDITKQVLPSADKQKGLITKDWDAFVYFYKGEEAWKKLDKNTAIRNYKSAISIDPNLLHANLRLADIYRFEGNNQQAIHALATVLPRIGKISKVDSIRSVALSNQLNGKTREAIKNYRDLIHYLPARKETYYELAEAFFEVRDMQNAKKYYQEALNIDPQFTQAINHYAYCFTHTGEHDKALKYFKQYLELDKSANAYDSYGDGLMAMGIYDSAEWAKREGLKMDPNLEFLYNGFSYIQIRQGEYKEAEDNVNKYLSHIKDNELLAEGYLNKAFIYYLQDDYGKSMDTCLKAQQLFDTLDLTSRNHKIHWLLCQLYYKDGNKEGVEEEMLQMKQLIEAYRIDATNYNEILKFYLHCQAIGYASTGNVEKVDEITVTFTTEIRDKIKDWSSPFDLAYFGSELGNIYLDLDKLGQAERCFQVALDYNPNFAQALTGMASIAARQNNTDLAEQYKKQYQAVWKN